MNPSQPHIVILGGSFAGLTVAYELKEFFEKYFLWKMRTGRVNWP